MCANHNIDTKWAPPLCYLFISSGSSGGDPPTKSCSACGHSFYSRRREGNCLTLVPSIPSYLFDLFLKVSEAIPQNPETSFLPEAKLKPEMWGLLGAPGLARVVGNNVWCDREHTLMSTAPPQPRLYWLLPFLFPSLPMLFLRGSSNILKHGSDSQVRGLAKKT